MKIKKLLEDCSPEEKDSIEQILSFAESEGVDDYDSLLEWDADELDDYLCKAFPIEY